MVKLLLEAGADAGATNHHGVTVLLSGAEGGHAGVVQARPQPSNLKC